MQPPRASTSYSSPSVPALKTKGFVTWQTIQLLLGPEEHVPFLQRAVSEFDIIDPVDHTQFPKVLPKECFPSRPDAAMTRWYEDVSRRLQMEAQTVARRQAPPEPRMSPRVAEESSDDSLSGAEKSDAAEYFSNPINRGKSARLAHRRPPRAEPKSSREYVADRGRAVVHRVRHMIGHDGRRRKGLAEHSSEEVLRDEISPGGLHPRYVPRRSSRQATPSPETSESEAELPRRRPSRSPRRQ